MAGGVTFDLSDFTIVLDQNAINKLAGGPDVTKALEIIGQAGEGSAKTHVAVDTGNLRRSLTHELGKRGLVQYVRVGSNVSYAVWQEIGTERMAAHPYLRPAMADIQRLIG